MRFKLLFSLPVYNERIATRWKTSACPRHRRRHARSLRALLAHGENSGVRDQLLNEQDYELFRDRQLATRSWLVQRWYLYATPMLAGAKSYRKMNAIIPAMRT